MEIPCFTNIRNGEFGSDPKPIVLARNGWKEVLIEALVVSHIYQAAHETDPEKALRDLITFETGIALDPKVSKEARRLQNTTPDVVFDTMRVWEALPGRTRIRMSLKDVSDVLSTISSLITQDRIAEAKNT